MAFWLCVAGCRTQQDGGVRRKADPDAQVEDPGPGDATSCEQLTCKAPATCKLTATAAVCVCPAGYANPADDATACEDSDECADGTNECDPNATCTNKPGGYDCACKEGFAGNGKLCQSRNDCEGAANTCHADALCMRGNDGVTCSCSEGFEGDGKLCVDRDECELGTAMCAANATCRNVRSNYDCVCGPLFEGDGKSFCQDACEIAASDASRCDPGGHARCAFTDTGVALCASCLGDSVGDGKTCQVNAECMGLGCGENQICQGGPGARSCACAPGFSGDPSTGCVDVDECAEGSSKCDGTRSKCLNTRGGYICDCQAGYERNKDGECQNIDECALGRDLCDPAADCTDLNPGYSCKCKSGFTGSDGFACQDIDECANKTASCLDDSTVTCQNTQGSYECLCPPGYTGDGKTEACYCDLSGYWAVREKATLVVPTRAAGAVVIIEESTTDATVWELHKYTYDGNTIKVEKRQCGANTAVELYSPLYSEWYSSATPNAVFDTLGFQRTVDIPMSKMAALPNMPFVTPKDATVQGIKLNDPVNDPWPKKHGDIPDDQWVDSDNDGEPGLSLWPGHTTTKTRDGRGDFSYLPVALQGDSSRIATRTGCVSTAIRTVGHFEGTINSCTRLSGRYINDRSEGRVHSCTVLRMSDWDDVDIDCTRADWSAARKCNDEQIAFLDDQDQTTRTEAEFETVKIGELKDEGLDCDAVRKALPATPGWP